MATIKSGEKLSGIREREKVHKAALKSSKTAFRISKALDLPIQIIEKGKLIEINADGSKHPVKDIPRITKESKGLKIGSRICLKPKD